MWKHKNNRDTSPISRGGVAARFGDQVSFRAEEGWVGKRTIQREGQNRPAVPPGGQAG